MALLEICCYGVDCAVSAQAAGADRIELCSAPKEGGLTPSVGTLRQVRQRISIPVHPIVRPRGGDFCYSAAEFDSMLADIAVIRELGFPGVVTGLLDEDGQVDLPRMRRIMAEAEGMAVTFHRAFDMCCDPFDTIEKLADLGVSRILTSGQQATAEKGLALITELKRRYRAPIIMAGCGVRLENLQAFMAHGIEELHSSASRQFASAMRFRQNGVAMSTEGADEEFSRYGVDGAVVAAMKAVLSGEPSAVAAY